MRILVACILYPVASGRFIQRALVRMGHDVRVVGPTTGNEIWGMTVDEKWAWKPDVTIRPHGLLFPTPMQDVQQILGEWVPELVITADSAYTLIGEFPCPHVLWGQDNHVRDYAYDLPGGVPFDAMFMAHTWGTRMDEPNAYWLPPCYDPVMCTDLGVERDLDMVVIGYPYPDRIALVEAMRQAGINIVAALGVIYDDYNALYNRAKIGFVKSSHGDVTNRMLENMAQGCCVLADRVADADKLGFVAGVDYWPYTTADEAVREARMLLEMGRWRAIAANGQRKVLAGGHTWDDRAAKMLEIVATMEEEPVSR